MEHLDRLLPCRSAFCETSSGLRSAGFSLYGAMIPGGPIGQIPRALRTETTTYQAHIKQSS